MSPSAPATAAHSDQPSLSLHLGHAGRRNSKEDTLLDGRLVVRSRDGLPGEEKSLIQILPQGKTGLALFTGVSTVVPAVAYRLLNPGAGVHLHFEDHWAYQTALGDLQDVPEELRPELSLSADPAPEIAGTCEVVALAFGQTGQTDLLRERIRHCANRHLARRGLLLCGYFGEADGFVRKEIERAFGSVSMVKTARRHSIGFVARRPDQPLVNEPTAHASFTIKEGEEVLEIRGRIGVFCHDRLDNGTRALLALVDAGAAGSVCDLGCGTGVVAVAMGRRLPGARLTCLDSSARAVESTRDNLERHGLLERATVLLHSEPAAALADVPRHDLMLANPPYYGNWRIAEAFLRAAVEGLVSGGRLYLVTKGPNWYRENCPESLDLVDAHQRGGYAVVEFVRL